jgi:hypothetical protein
VIWFFERGAELAECEVRRGATHFEIAIRRPDRDLETVEVSSARELLARLEQAPRALMRDGWRPRPVDFLAAASGLYLTR